MTAIQALQMYCMGLGTLRSSITSNICSIAVLQTGRGIHGVDRNIGIPGNGHHVLYQPGFLRISQKLCFIRYDCFVTGRLICTLFLTCRKDRNSGAGSTPNIRFAINPAVSPL